MTDRVTTPRAALLTPRGRGAVATIRYCGDVRLIDGRLGSERSEAPSSTATKGSLWPTPATRGEPPLFRAANGKPLARQSAGRVLFGWWGTTAPEDVVVCRLEEGTLEIHCHGGEAAVRRILDDLKSRGCRIIDWPELNSIQAGLFETECLQALSRATTARTAAILLEQQTGLLKTALEALAADLASDQEAGGSGRESGAGPCLDALLRWAEFGLHLTRPWKVVLAGRPNVGKSSLINALMGYSRSIVFDQPGTTRDIVSAETAFEGWLVELSDTAGIARGADELESAGIERALGTLQEADCRVLLFDTSRPLDGDDRRLLRDWPEAIRVAHKCDLPCVWGDGVPDGMLAVSSVTGRGVGELAKVFVSRLVPEVPPAGTAIPVTQRQVDLLGRARDALGGGDVASARAAVDECLGKSKKGERPT